MPFTGNSLVVQWLGLHAFTAKGPSLIPGLGLRSHISACRTVQPKKKKYMKL